MFQYCGIHQVVDQHHFGLAQGAHGLEGQQFRVAGAGADEPDFAVHIILRS
ncbi:hypothetical protein D3C80_2152060 [compost metagenome]